MRFHYSTSRIVLLAVISTTACATLQNAFKSTNDFAIEQVELFKPGIAKREEVLTQFGAPDFKALAPGFKNEEVWTYHAIPVQKGYPRISFIFDTERNVLLASAFYLNDDDSERNMDVLKKRFPQANFKRREEEWDNPHAGPSEFYLEDDNIGLSVTCDIRHSKPNTIHWYVRDFDEISRQNKLPDTEPKPTYILVEHP